MSRPLAVLAGAAAVAVLLFVAFVGDDPPRRSPPETTKSSGADRAANPDSAAELRRTADADGKGRIFGIVRDDTGVPLSGVTVTLDTGVESATDELGKFTFSPTAVDDEATREVVTRHDTLPPVTVKFVAWQEETEVQVKLYRPVAIEGLVVDHEGRSVAGVKIRTKGFQTTSGKDGSFRILGKRGTYPLAIETPPGMFVPHSIRATAPGEIRIVVRPIPPGRTFRFTLADAHSKEVVKPSEVIGYRDRLGLYKRAIRFVPEEDGGRVEDLTPGRWVLRIETEKGWAAIHRLDVADRDPAPATIRIAAPVKLYGRVRVHRVPENQRPHWLWLRRVAWAGGRYFNDGRVVGAPRAGWRRRGQFPLSHEHDYQFIIHGVPAGARLRLEVNANGWYGMRQVDVPYERETDTTIHVQPAGRLEVYRVDGTNLRSIEYAVRPAEGKWPPYRGRWNQARTIFGEWLPPGPVEWRVRYWPFEGTDFKVLTGTAELEADKSTRIEVEMR